MLTSLSSSRRFRIGAALLTAAVVCIFFPALRNGCCWDDAVWYLGNPLTRGLSPASVAAIFTDFSSDFYKPLVYLSHAIEAAILGPSPSAAHAVNIALHAVNSVLVFALVRRWSSWAVAWPAALLFAVHPLHVESVAWISQRKDLLYSFFWLSSLLCYDSWRRGGERRLLFFSLLLFLGSLLSKSVGVTLPLVMMAADRLVYEKKTAISAEMVPFLALSIVFGLLTLRLQASLGALKTTPHVFPASLFDVSDALFFYFSRAVAPLGLSCLYPFPAAPGTFFQASPYTSALIAATFLTASAFVAFLKKETRMPLTLFYLTLAPALPWRQVGLAPFADRYFYLPALGLCMAAACLCGRRTRLVLWFAVAAFSVLSFRQCAVWQNDGTLWANAIHLNPSGASAQMNYGAYLLEMKRYEEAGPYLNGAVRAMPEDASANANAGIVAFLTGNPVPARAYLETALRLDPALSEGYVALARLEIADGNLDAATKTIDKGLERARNPWSIRMQKSRVYLLQRRFDESLAEIEKVLAHQPSDSGALRMKEHILQQRVLGPAKRAS